MSECKVNKDVECIQNKELVFKKTNKQNRHQRVWWLKKTNLTNGKLHRSQLDIIVRHNLRRLSHLRSPLFLCTVAYTCPELTVPSNGIKFGCPENATMYNDTVCQFSCNDGYIANGSQARRCQLNGTWSGQDFTCQSRYYMDKFANKSFNDDNFMPSKIRNKINDSKTK